jgi:hypothetical protein
VVQDPDEIVPNTIRLPRKVWEAIDHEARRLFRSRNKHLEAVLTERYDLQDSDETSKPPKALNKEANSAPIK